MTSKGYIALFAVAILGGVLGSIVSIYVLIDRSAFAADSSRRPAVIESEGFQVFDKEGKPRAHLGFGASGKTTLMLGYDEDKSRADLSSLPDGSAALSIIGADGKSTSLSWDADGLMGLMFFDKKRTRRMALTTDPDGVPSLVFYDQKENVTWKAP